MSILSYLQRIGRALMVPVAALPAAAILMGIGYWLDPNGWGADSQLAALLIKSGAAIIDNMSLLFAVGVAFGMSEDKHGSAALSGLVGFMVVTTLLSPGAVAQLEGIAIDQVPAAFGKINNQFVGILVGAISAAIYNRYYKTELPAALAFFSGKRLVPILVSIAAIVLSFILLYVWPVIFGGLVGFGESIKDMGAVGAGIYGFFNRLLIPIGLHHALNSVFWFDVAGINDIPNFLGGAQSLAEGRAVLGVTGMYQAGFFPIMMFGLPGAALAIYHMARPENKTKVASLMIAAALASFFTGITEPLEFSFMFVAPLLYVVHALLTGISVFFAATMQWIAGFGFSAGLVDMVLSSQNPLAQNWYMLILQGLVFSVIYYVIFTACIKMFRLKTPGREDMQDEEAAQTANTSQAAINKREKAQQFVAALGGKENISSIDACITRLRLVLLDRSKINEKQLKALGSKGNVKLGDNALQVILGPEAEIIADEMKTL
ncbi:PTS system N-acetylglucosamine-specific IIB component, Glc family (TC 4.A.1.1.2)/PTS system N-acetylglucosamine-specific IIC component, Glc family (TC 4.A.1.1.2) [Pasteurella testudinis DSM 23072]|uniref:PTS system N-acetylglucosamine-specific IIB component, Glc family (TC 4.A.1.1.2)/PTS system N-acetylglucosamine-specific IIC component, Glc family (TC 4.A.1.1.2) n=1 Tax=Pasteurella testudinis DSM 23072 TaxID=1122938 RepID=A0A1W1V4C5_9PAST|nr:N-acetylglucosamine-specific PTS transporter subunit IIBC [Pasteurella testudinis]SMB88217.1 PTS system N-acetylglucosamine-specific IIB component, Glc family (TC 4.A.1.1.2)/PTS system N-acetylglucosamine-specific IIC component, Glc family (TC 4.A.1.1.2) [Pasteurella testudinis DSM 23072]SUB51167.1 PTS system N-acetylglucosamine-specific transporter subunit IICBA [Pasteurella testudinis]